MRVMCIEDDAGVAWFAAEWEALSRRLPNATPFQSPVWLLAWWRRFGTGMPRVLAAWEGEALAGVLPLYELHEPGIRKLLPIGIGVSDYVDALIDPASPDTADALMRAVGDIPGWQECHLPDLPPGAALLGATVPLRVQEERRQTVSCPMLALPASVDELARIVPKKTLRDCRQAASRAAAVGGAVVETADAGSVQPCLDDLFQLHAARWQTRGEGGVLADPAVQAFHREAAAALCETGMLRLYRLRIGDDAAGVYYGFCCNGRAYAYIGGFDPSLSRLSPGALLLRHAIAEAIAEGAREFHFLRGGEAYKYSWGAVDRWNSARTLKRA
jgi:CelD/BcsL family acetyltransferase involved in cellulose biosynthesis